MDGKTRVVFKFFWAFGLIVLGLFLNLFGIGSGEFVGYGSVGSFLIYIGFLGFAVILFSGLLNRNKTRDERMDFVAAKALRVTFLVFVVVAFALMVLDGIQPITMPYHLFLSYLVSGIIAVLFVSYKILLRHY